MEPSSTEVLIGRVLERLEGQDKSASKFESEIKAKLDDIKDQTTKTNGRVTGLEAQTNRWQSQIDLIKYAMGGGALILGVCAFFFGSSIKHIPNLDEELKGIHSDIASIKDSPSPAIAPTPFVKKNGH